ncbi:MAG: porin family protein [Hyphomonadaceae bacterium]|nr:porin family protein [Hyphomonadaceae bacterium]MBX3509775.1 porin family protein [Hyphomonadaceae bacterium]
MNKFAMLAAVSAIAVCAVPAAAHAQAYAGAGYTWLDSDAGDMGAVTGRLGYRFNPNFAVEGEASFGVDDDGVELDNNIGAYAVAILPVASTFDVHGRVGYQRSEFDTPIGGFDSEGVGYGVGATWRATPNLGVRADYTRLDGDNESDAISLGGVVNF